MDITGLEINLLTNEYIVANVKVQFDDFFMVKLSIRKTRAGGLFISWPRNEYKDKENKTQYEKLVWFESKKDQAMADANRRAIDDYIMAEFNKQMASTGKKSVSPTSKPTVTVRVNRAVSDDVPPAVSPSGEVDMSAEDLAFQEALYSDED